MNNYEKRKIGEVKEVKNCGCYIRVSTAEQKQKGMSLEAQRAGLIEFCDLQGWKIIDFYADEGITAKKDLHKRKEFMRLMHDIEKRRINQIVVMRLDRFFRNVYDYHWCMRNFIEKYGAEWCAVKENYDTNTPNGRMLINIKLSIAEMECEVDSVRIKDVMEHLINNGRTVGGDKALPFGFEVKDLSEEKGYKYKIVSHKADEEETAMAAIEEYEKTLSVRQAMLAIQARGFPASYKSTRNFLDSPLLCGMRGENENYCEPYITRERWEAMQKNLNHTIRFNPRRIYIFSGLVFCPDCGRRMAGGYGGENRTALRYRCQTSAIDANCPNRKMINEKKLEKELLEILRPEFEKYNQTEKKAVVEKKKKNKTVDNTAQIRQKQKRLNDLYINGMIDFEEYKNQFSELEKQIVKSDNGKDPEIKTEEINKLINNINTFYSTLSKEEKVRFWRGIIEKIYVKDGHIIKIDFLK